MRRLLILTITLALFPLAALADDFCRQEVPTAQGAVTGVPSPTDGVCVYRGVPYAAPPVGNLRWRAPQLAPARPYVYAATDFGPICMQGGNGEEIDIHKKVWPRKSEDCLYLNVYRPQKSGVFPVMFWIHGGSYTSGAGSGQLYWGDKLAAAQDVVVVTINYRLGMYGFMSHPELAAEDEHHSTGNYGMLDQVGALQWVKENIAGFGGDPQNVTIFGESAGGWSVCTLVASPLAAGLFQKAVIESGGCDAVHTLADSYRNANEVIRRAGCKGADPIACLRRLTPEGIEAAFAATAAREKKTQKRKTRGFKMPDPKAMAAGAKKGWLPTIDGWALTDRPVNLIRSGKYNQTPLMAGSNRDELKLFTLAVPAIQFVPKFAIDSFSRQMFGREKADYLAKLYPWPSRRYRLPMDATLDALGDMALGCKTWEAAAGAAPYAQVYYYRFDYDNHLAPHLLGAAHGIEIPFVFGNVVREPASMFFVGPQNAQAKKLSDLMMAYWANFARTGNPNGGSLPQWGRYTTADPQRMVLDWPLQPSAPTDNIKKCEFWREAGFTMGAAESDERLAETRMSLPGPEWWTTVGR